MSAETVTISSLGTKGDGVAHDSNGPIFVPFALPGETVSIAKVKNEGTIMSFATTSPDRVQPPCKHFGPDGVGGVCGGCSLQHFADQPYHAFKRELVVSALRTGPMLPERTACVLAAKRSEEEVKMGTACSRARRKISRAPARVPLSGLSM